MALRELSPVSAAAPVQNTTFSIDALARNICNTWDEAVDSGGPPFTVIVVGSGAYGATWPPSWRPPSGRPRAGAGGRTVPGGRTRSETRQRRAERRLAYRAEQRSGCAARSRVGSALARQCRVSRARVLLRGKVAVLGRMVPPAHPRRPRGSGPPRRPRTSLSTTSTSSATPGWYPHTDFIHGDLLDVLSARSLAVAGLIANLDVALPGGAVQNAPIAVQGEGPVSGLFSFDKYSSMPDADRSDPRRHRAIRRVGRAAAAVPRASRTRRPPPRRTRACPHDRGRRGRPRKFLPSGRPASSSRPARSRRRGSRSSRFQRPLMGRNLMAHIRSDFTVRIRRSALAPIPDRGSDRRPAAARTRRRSAVPPTADSLDRARRVGRMLPDDPGYRPARPADREHRPRLDHRHAARDRGHDRRRGHARRLGRRRAGSTSARIESDEYGVPRAYVHLRDVGRRRRSCGRRWTRRRSSSLQRLAGRPGDIEYLYDGGWQPQPFPLSRPFPPWHWGLGTTYHESGTLWMGETPRPR